jgi:hypothetical protein
VASPGSGWGSLAGCCECGDEPSGSGATASQSASYEFSEQVVTMFLLSI